MESLKSVISQKRSEKKEDFGDKKYVTRGDILDNKYKRIREEEKKITQKKKLKEIEIPVSSNIDIEKNQLPDLSKEEVIRRLRAHGQPATYFAESDVERLRRLMTAEAELNVDDEMKGGQQTNLLIELQKEEKKKNLSTKIPLNGDTTDHKSQTSKQALIDIAADETMEYFKKASERLQIMKKEAELSIEERIGQQLKIWCDEWQQDLDARSEEVKKSPTGVQATMAFKQNMKWLTPLFHYLENKDLEEDMVAGLWIIVQYMRDRNYQHAYEIYLRLAIGNAPWPIGVTSVGIHERSAREKISHTRNIQGSAHIMNDEATRKYLQGIKRLMTFVQRAYPTQPSRSVDFNTNIDLGRGVAGSGSDRIALLSSEQTSGGSSIQHRLPLPPNVLEDDGKSVRVPQRWSNVLKKAKDKFHAEKRNKKH